ncbi:zona pellucida sperm-binding protein 4-like [Platysternon megacephalum]|uniref:Zona pellucida sperm-binding protein 4-like n=1 Tax=Platysternon megacephalum TaxID=55544 RepID=A0A4D9EMY9_9SAUR|nr:zona pellucida sperm-binding protein 4-like [Platysternon megacephalum]
MSPSSILLASSSDGTEDGQGEEVAETSEEFTEEAPRDTEEEEHVILHLYWAVLVEEAPPSRSLRTPESDIAKDFAEFFLDPCCEYPYMM